MGDECFGIQGIGSPLSAGQSQPDNRAVVVITVARSLIAYLDIDVIKLADSPIPSTIPRLINLVAGLAPFVLGTSLDVLGRFNFG